ncbi:hypothetical protein L226DRAFT_497514 [Lentinus tigrinus ALCF2SS1-7]|uniref:uncharacterized protein n=1 Tax=Lentinus tigrinus ALCF2SS1-7 TaxID=1328758 RepID=UPI0011661DE7|nr:hypothetical protein L226DRAFT_497514 [Lentinus tigrinus ALCF2SS1-7]
MPPAPSSPASSRPWWSRSKSSKDSLRPNRSVSSLAEEDEKYPSTASSASPRSKDALPALKFNTLASAMGLKSKKLPALTIQDPPSPLPSPRVYPHSRPGSGNSSAAYSPAPVERTPFFTNRPPAKSISTVRSSEYDYDAASEPHSEPRTPSDHPRDRLSYQHSVMTFSEIDPFASGGIVVQQLPQDPNRLSVYSDSSMLDPQHKRPDMPPHNRGSYGSSSSNSHGNYSDVQALSPLSAASSFGRSPPASRSAYDLSHTHDSYYMDSPSTSSVQAQRTRRTKTPSGSNSSNSTVTAHDYRVRLSEPGGGTALHLSRKRSSPSLARPRGMTVGAIDHRPSTATTTLGLTQQPLQVPRKASGSSSPSSSNTPSPSPVTISGTRSTSSTSTNIESPVSPSFSKRPLVVVRKASSSRLPPLPAAPPTSDLPPPPVPTSPYDMSPIEFRASSSSSSLNFAPSVDLHDIDAGDAISQLMNNSYDLGPFEARDSGSARGKRRSNRNMYVLDGDLSPVSPADIEASLPSPLSKFPPVPVSVFGEIHPKAGKLLEKMSSQQNLLQRHSSASVSSSSGPPDETHGHSNGHASHHSGKTPRKQRSFHASRVPLPPLPGLRHGSSSNGHHASTGTEALTQPSSPVVEPRRSSVNGPRKRLFSGSSARRSTSSHGPSSPAEDDKRSVFSFDSDIRPATSSGGETITMSFGGTGGPLSLMTRNACIAPSSLWEDASNKRTSQSEYIPQYIMSPAEQLKLAEKLADEDAIASVREPEREPVEERKPKLDLQPGDFGLTYSVNPSSARSRSNSVLSNTSTGTLAFGPGGDKGGVSRGVSILPSKSLVNASRASTQAPQTRKVSLVDPTRSGPSRSSSMLAKALNRPPPLSARPSTAQASLTPPSSPGFQTATRSPEFPSASLPPPPRRRPSRHDLQEIENTAMKRVSVVPINPLSPPPSVRSSRVRRQESSDTTTTMSRPPSSFDRQKIMQRRSLMKKPSFLDIEDEVDMSAENGSDEEYGTATVLEVPDSPGADFESSFLDMDRGKNSFDTVRSTDSAFFV